MFDTHTHAWGAPSPDHPWTNGPLVEESVNHFSTDIVYTADELLTDMDRAGVDEAVIVGYPITDWTDNWYTMNAAEENDRLSGIAMIDQFADGAADTLQEVMAHDGTLGFRLGALCPYDEMWERFDYDETWLRDAIDETEFWEAAIETDAVVQILSHTSQLDQALQLVEAYPELRYTFDHFAHADASVDPAESFAEFEPLSEYENVTVKISEIAHTSNEEHPYEDAFDHVRWLLDTFGRERVLWGSDFPNVSHPEFGGMEYAETYEWLDEVPFLSDADRRWLCNDAARTFFDL
ncbi:amidohydrolase family protein [Halocatena marina]|uniref:Amidohydrolase family protein n=1 Tax=Halocatena marina TaxID=2934937 RepID=A0ABD5YZ21_9EURY|nr:amidohydrolase family protein [Halocatena marina]